MRIRVVVISIIVLMVYSFPLPAVANADKSFQIKTWLKLGPGKLTDLENRVFENIREKINNRYLNIPSLRPLEGKRVRWNRNVSLKWEKSNDIRFKKSASGIWYFASYIDAYKRLKTKLLVENTGESLIDIFLDGQPLKKAFSKKEGKIRAEIDLLNEKHILVLKIFAPGNGIQDLSVKIIDGDLVRSGSLKFSRDLSRRVNFRNILNMTRVGNIRLSPNGKYAAISLSKTGINGKSDSWSEILRVSDGKTVFSTEHIGKIRGLQWMKDSKGFTYTRTENKKESLYYMNLYNFRQKKLFSNISDFSSYWWSPDNSYLIYSTYKKEETGKGFKYISTVPDRSSYGGYKYSFYIYFPDGKVTRKLSKLSEDFSNVIISPDGGKIILTKDENCMKNRPYFKTSVYSIDFSSFKLEKVLESNFARPVCWSPDSKKILFSGGPSSFNGIGKSPELKKGQVPNDYDNQLFLYSLNTGSVDPLTRDFDPSVSEVFWNPTDNSIYFTAEDRSYVKLFKFNLKNRKFIKFSSGPDVIRKIDISLNNRSAVFWGSGSVSPHKLYKVNLKSRKVYLLKDYNFEDFSSVKFGKLENWNYKKPGGEEIIGRIYYPVLFNPQKKYPCIVYYYGGTSPVERSFGGRYPFNWYAANGYIVYVLQPSGATGFGQKFSSYHVNDWGLKTSDEIIGATKELLKTHPFIDPKRVGAMGASYGGFLTEYLATQTDIFSAFISHAGISALSSYWGVGDWGYTYSGIATANSFPWNRKDLYVGHSPLFMADRINTPLLLLHGDVDNNVPPGESYQMFLALKLLGREVALVTFKGQSHWILEYGKRVRWMKTIIAWFDKWLKRDPFYWDSLYKKYEKGNG